MEPSIDCLLSALAEPTRLRALQIVWAGHEPCTNELIARLGATQSRVSRHMQRLEQVGLLSGRRDVHRMRYCRPRTLAPDWVAIVEAVLAGLPPLAASSGKQAGGLR